MLDFKSAQKDEEKDTTEEAAQGAADAVENNADTQPDTETPQDQPETQPPEETTQEVDVPEEPQAESTQQIEQTIGKEQIFTEPPEERKNHGNPYDKPKTKPKKPKSTKANIFITVSLFIIIFIGAFGYMAMNKDAFPFIARLLERTPAIIAPIEPPPEDPTEPPPKEPTEPVTDPEAIIEYINPDFEFSLSYRNKAKFIEPGSFNTPLETYQVIYEGPTQGEEITGPENLKDGYIMAMTIHYGIINKDVDNIALEKRNKYLLSCDASAKISNIGEKTVANRTAKTFEVTNCGVNYIQTFFVRGNDLYEFNQMYRADIGIRQVYRAETDEVIEMFKFINTIQPTPQDTWTKYESAFIPFTFKYPSELDSTCCTLKGPLSSTAQKVVVFADPKSLAGTNGTLFNGFGVYTDSLGEVEYETYLEQQRNLLKENYQIIMGKKPVTSEEEIFIGEMKATVFKGYAWWGDLVLFKYTGDRGPSAAIFVKTEIDPDSFESLFREILSTVEFRQN